ncbi:MAG: hypothetical protein H6668_08665 [Ardenticatenaceae bacterium]|nr:hypothetical protein [Ardenticatenaceae bacterium]
MKRAWNGWKAWGIGHHCPSRQTFLRFLFGVAVSIEAEIGLTAARDFKSIGNDQSSMLFRVRGFWVSSASAAAELFFVEGSVAQGTASTPQITGTAAARLLWASSTNDSEI